MGQCLGRQVKPLPRSRRPKKKTAVPVTTANGSGLQNSTLYAIDGESDKKINVLLDLWFYALVRKSPGPVYVWQRDGKKATCTCYRRPASIRLHAYDNCLFLPFRFYPGTRQKQAETGGVGKAVSTHVFGGIGPLLTYHDIACIGHKPLLFHVLMFTIVQDEDSCPERNCSSHTTAYNNCD